MTDRLRVLWVSPKLPYPLLSGDKIRQFNLLRQLSSRHSIDLVTFLERPEHREFVPVLEKYCDRVTGIPLPSRKRFLVQAVRALDPRTAFFACRYESSLLRQAISASTAEREYDIVQIEHVYMAPYFGAIHPSRRPARVLTLHNIESILSARCAAIERQRMKRWYWRLESKKLLALERRWLPAIEAVVVMSSTDRRAVERIVPGARVSIVENGVDTDEYEVGPDAHRDRSVVFTGSLGYPPNADGVTYFLDEVWPLVRQAVPDAVCVIVGRDPAPSLVARHGQDGVVVTGPVENVRPYLARAGVVVIPLRAGGGTRLKILEAMATGGGIVSTRVGAEGLDVRDGHELLLADSAQEFARATIELLTDRALRRRLGEAARQRVEERYDWRFAVDALDHVYQTVASPRQARCVC